MRDSLPELLGTSLNRKFELERAFQPTELRPPVLRRFEPRWASIVPLNIAEVDGIQSDPHAGPDK
jgi:hypothetical protein